MLAIAGRKRVVAGRDGVLASNTAIAAMGDQLAATLIPEHVPSGFLSIALGAVDARNPVGVVALVNPSTVWTLEYRSIS